MRKMLATAAVVTILFSLTGCGGGGDGDDGGAGSAGNGGGINGTALKAVDDAVAVKKWMSTVIKALENDSGELLAILSVTSPAHGTATVNTARDGLPPGSVIFYNQTDGNFVGDEVIAYEVGDGHGNKTTATITITILPNLLPLPIAVDDTATTQSGVPVTVRVMDNDANYSVSRGVGFSYPGNGTCVSNPDGTITYTPSAEFVGQDVFTYGIQNDDLETVTGTVTVTVTP